MEKEGFNLYREAKDNYNKLIPNQIDGLVILSIYEKFREGKFTEDNIYAIINKVYNDAGKGGKTNLFERNNKIVLRLQESFLWRDPNSKTYTFKKYGLEFCENVYERLEKNYNPAKIKRWFDQLYASLDRTLQGGDNFNNWITDHFDLRKPELAMQIEILDHQVNKSVIDFKKNIKSKNAAIIDVLEQIEFGLDLIKTQSKELSSAFSISYDIDDKLTGILEKGNASDHIDNIKKVRDFHDNSRNHLEQVSARIDKIKPQIREFIYNFNRGHFDRKTDEFIQFLLENSTTKRMGSIKTINFPESIPRFSFKEGMLAPKLTVIPIKEFAPKLPTPISRRKVNNEDKLKLIEKTQKWKAEKERIMYWTKFAFAELEKKSVLDFSHLFFEILAFDSFPTAVKTTHKVLRTASKKSKQYQIQVSKEPYVTEITSKIKIWQVIIQKI